MKSKGLVNAKVHAVRVLQRKTGFIRGKQGSSEKNRVYHENRVHQRKTGFIREKQGSSEKNRVFVGS